MVICQVKLLTCRSFHFFIFLHVFWLLNQKPIPPLSLSFFFFGWSPYCIFFLFFLLYSREPPSPPQAVTISICLLHLLLLLLHLIRAAAATTARNSSRSRSSSTDGTANFWSLPEPIPTSYSDDLGFFEKLSSSTIVFQLESLRSMSGSYKNQG